MLLRTEAIQVYKETPFVFVSGRISPVYIDCRKILSFAEEREYVVTQLAKKPKTTSAWIISTWSPAVRPPVSLMLRLFLISSKSR